MTKQSPNHHTKFLLLLFLLLTIARGARCSPPDDPITCTGGLDKTYDCTITNSYGAFPDRATCRFAKVAYPTSEADVIWAVGNATKSGTKMKVGTRYSHSIPKLVCPDGQDGMVISTKYLDRVLKVDVEEMSMTVESGATLRRVIDEAARFGMALPYAPYWWGLTVGGMLGTGAHGSSLWGLGSQVHDYVTGMRIVSPSGVRTLKATDPGLDAARVSLGVLGVITQVTLKLQPLFKRSVTYVTKNDSGLGDDVVGFGREHEFADFVWTPSQMKVSYRIDDRVAVNESGDGLNDFPGFRSTSSLILSTLRASEETQESLGDANGKCINGIFTTSALRTTAFGLTNNGILFTGYPVIGYQNRIQASGTCLDSPQDADLTACPWDPRIKGLFFHQTTFSIALPKAKPFIQDIRTLVKLEPKSLCGLDLNNGILMRYVTASSAYLGKQEDSIDFDLTYYRARDPMSPRLFEDILEEIEQMAVFKYGALPHWGKNRNVAFVGAINKYRNADKFLKVKAEYDPLGLFSSEWTDQVLGLKEGLSVEREGCALEGLCVCSQDIHCAPSKGYFCRAGKVYGKARVCSKVKGIIS
ncbi:D-arabinono-1,4-lactone oxidase family protein [Striga asiatica]|uniref:L-gulonolactone oxidase n=1 Tax=Striga asiatica TaxID=4170 RepID=A0A5A7QUX2_STRAF|nr:D-arabinono-1,4-lactone oxidase family protein [Striga asiatica]